MGESKGADGETRCSPQQDQIPSHGVGVERGRLQSFIQMKLTFIPATLSRNAGKIVLLDLRIVELHYPWVCTIITI